MSKQNNQINFNLPSWLDTYILDIDTISDKYKRMEFVVEASRLNVLHQTGGPFAAAIFEKKSAKLIALGVNLVTSTNSSTLHAEIVAIMLAQQMLGVHNFLALGEYELVTSTEPCAMCLGAIPWAGLSYILSGATDKDARSIGFDEGSKVEDWIKALNQRGISVDEKILSTEAKSVLQLYKNSNAEIY